MLSDDFNPSYQDEPRGDPIGYDEDRLPQHLTLQYEELGAYHWAAEVLTNIIAASATKAYFALEPQGAVNNDVFRRCVVDNGCGLTKDKLRFLFEKIGRTGGGKSTATMHDFFGIGARMSLWPWNRTGVIICSWVDGEGSMIWLRFDKRDNRFTIRNWVMADNSPESVLDIDPDAGVDPETGIDYHLLKNTGNIIKDSGTVVVLLGDSLEQDTILGDPNKSEDRDLNGLSRHLNLRFWDTRGVEVKVDCLRSHTRANWLHDLQHADLRRHIGGAKYYVIHKRSPKSKRKVTRKLAARGEVKVKNATIEWFLSEPIPKGQFGKRHNEAVKDGVILVEYKNEIYADYAHPATFTMFGINYSSVRQRLVLVIHPNKYGEPFEEGGPPAGGVLSPLTRSGLVYRDEVGAASEPLLPLDRWGREFRRHWPDEIKAAHREAAAGGKKLKMRSSNAILSKAQELLEQVGWVPVTNRKNGSTVGTDANTGPSKPGSSGASKKKKKTKKKIKKKKKKKKVPGGGGRQSGSADPSSGIRGTYDPATLKIPDGRAVCAADMGCDAFHIATYAPSSGVDGAGRVLLNDEHPSVVNLIQSHQAKFDISERERVANRIIRGLLDELRLAVVFNHAQYMRHYNRDTIEQTILTPHTLSAMINTVLTNKRRITEFTQGLSAFVDVAPEGEAA